MHEDAWRQAQSPLLLSKGDNRSCGGRTRQSGGWHASCPGPGTGSDGLGEYEFITGRTISLEFTPKGEKAYKFKGGRYSKFGVRVWSEVMQTLGRELDSLRPETDYKVDKQAKILIHEGKAQKVVAFLGQQEKTDLSAV